MRNLQLPSCCDYSVDLSILAALVLSNLSVKSVPSISVQEFCWFGSIGIVGNGFHAAMSKLPQMYITNPTALYHVAFFL